MWRPSWVSPGDARHQPRGDEVADDAGYDLGKGAGFYLNATEQPWASHYRMYDYIADELPALIQREFAVSNRCAISGDSMGGHGALIMALKILADTPAFPRLRQ